MNETILLTTVIDLHEVREVMVADVPNSFIHTEIPDLDREREKVCMKITGELVS